MTRKLTFLILALFALIAGPGWGQTYTISFVKGTTNGTNISTQLPSNASTMCESGSEHIASFNGTNVYYNSAGCGLRLAKSGGDGTFTITFPNSIQEANIKEVIIYASAVASGNTIDVTPAGTVTAKTTFSSLSTYSTFTDISTYAQSAISINGTLTSLTFGATSKKYVHLHKIDIVTSDTPTKELESLAISGNPTKTTYETGEEFDPAGLVVTGTYDDESQAEITSGITWNVTPNPLTVGTTSVSVTATVGTVTSEPYLIDGLIVNEHVITPGTYEIIPNTTFFGIEAQTTGSHDAVTGTQNDITITHSGGSNFYCNESQIRTYKGNTLTFSVPSGYEITSIVLAVTDNASYSANVGTYTVSTKTWTGNAQEVVLTSGQNSGNYQITKITVTFISNKTLESIALTTAPAKTEYNAGETFDPTGLVITATYDDESTEDIAYAGHESDFTFSPELTTPLTISNTSVTITYGDKNVSQPITVTEAPKHTVSYHSNGVVTSDQVYAGVIQLTAPTNIPNGYTYVGWTDEPIPGIAQTATYFSSYNVTEHVDLYAVFAMVKTSGENALVKMSAGNTLNDGDKIVIVATIEVEEENEVEKFALYQETTNTSYVSKYTFDNNIETILADDKNWLTVSTAEGGFTLGDATNGYLYSSGNNLYIGETAQTWTLSDLTDGTFKIQSDGRNLSYRHDLTNQYWRMGGASYGTSGQTVLDIYKISTSSITYSNFCTTVNALSGPITQSDITANTAYYINAVTTINSAVEIAALTNDNPANLIIKDDGQLIHHNAGVAATFQKNITGYTSTNDNYYLIAAPIADASIEGLTTNEYDLFSYDEPTHYWFNQKGTANPFNTLSLGQGYLYANSTTGNVTISGIISNEQDPTIAVTASASNLTGFNLVGNPFSYNLSISDMAMMDDDTEIYDITSIYQISGTAVVASQNTSVAPCEGFFIQAPVAGELYFNAGSSRSAKSPVSDLKVEVKEATRSAQLIDRAYVNFSESRPMNKFYLNENSTRLYIPQNGKDYAVVMANAAEGELPVNFKAEKNGTYTITVNTENVEANYLHLIDNLTGMDTDLLSTPSYTFDAKTSDYASRFKLVFSMNDVESNQVEASSFAYINNGEIIISNEGRATLQVIDVLGRIVRNQQIEGDARISTEDLTAGLYILNLNGNVQKIVVR